MSFGIVKWGLSLLKHGKLSKKNPEQAVEVAKEIGNSYYIQLKDRIISCQSKADKINLIESFAEEYLSLAFVQVMYCSYGLKVSEKIDKWLRKHYGDFFDLDMIKQGLANNPTTEMGLELSRIAKAYKSLGQVPNEADKLIVDFLKKYGHRATVEVDFGTRRWKDDVKYPLEIIKQYMENDVAEDNIKRFTDQNKMALELIDHIYERVRKDKGKRKADKIKSSYLNFRTTAGIRELPKYDMLRCMDLLKDMVNEIAAEMVSEQIIKDKDDINFLEFDQIINHVRYDIKSIIDTAKIKYGNQSKYKSIPRFILSSGECFYQPSQVVSEDNSLKGFPISSGTFEGTVKVLNEANTESLSKENVLVTHNTNPAWTPLFLTVGALVMENGGPISHGAIVAREYGLPAVAGIANVTSLLKDGDRVIVDGSRGTVKLINQ